MSADLLRNIIVLEYTAKMVNDNVTNKMHKLLITATCFDLCGHLQGNDFVYYMQIILKVVIINVSEYVISVFLVPDVLYSVTCQLT
jgi:hypothetical protein